MSSEQSFPTINKPRIVTLKCGDKVSVRAALRSERTSLFQAAEFREGDVGSVARLTDLAVRWGSVAKEGSALTDKVSGAGVKFRREKAAGLGEIASEAYLNALDDADVEAITAIVLNSGELSEDAGN